MRKKHTEEDRLRYMKMLEEGYSLDYIHKHYGIGITLLQSLWIKYQSNGPLVLIKKKYIKADGTLKEKIVRDIEENGLTLWSKQVIPTLCPQIWPISVAVSTPPSHGGDSGSSPGSATKKGIAYGNSFFYFPVFKP